MVAASPGARFGIDARWFADGPPSGRNYVRHLVAALAARSDAGEFAAFAHGPSVPAIRRLGLRVVPTPALPSFAFNLVGIPARTPRSVTAVLHQNFTPPWSRAGTVTVIHDLIFLRRPEQFSRAERAYLSLIPLLLPGAGVVLTVSEHVRSEVLERWPKRDPASVVVAPNGIDDALLDAEDPQSSTPGSNPPPAARVRGRYRIERPYMLYLGRINRRKNLVALVQAFDQACLAEHDLLLVGPDDGGVQDVVEAIRHTRSPDRIRLLGRVPDADVRALLAGADAFAYVSLDEGFGVPPLEAMALGVPVVASDIPALRETALGGGAILVSPSDVSQISEALRRATSDDAVRERARRQGPPHARTFRWSATASRVRLALERAAA